MKKLVFSMLFFAGISLMATAQDKKTVVKDEKTTKPTSSAKQRVHNTFSKDKEHNGTKTTHKKVVEKTTSPSTN